MFGSIVWLRMLVRPAMPDRAQIETKQSREMIALLFVRLSSVTFFVAARKRREFSRRFARLSRLTDSLTPCAVPSRRQ
jgi:hypothetical protein